jgi:hypothetical protein
MESDRGAIRAVADDRHELPQSSCFAFGEQRRHQLSTDTSTGPCRVQVDRVFGGMAVSRPQAVGRRVGVTDDLSGTLGDEIGIVAADDIEAPPSHVILARRFDLKRREPIKDVMRVDCGDRRDVVLLTCVNGDVGGRQSSAHYNFRIGNIVIRPRGDPDGIFCQRTSLAVCDPRSCATALSTWVSFHARGRVSRTIAATSSSAGVRPIASLNSPYRTGDNAPAPIVPV